MSLSENMHNGDRSDIRDGEKIMKIPKLGLIICNSGASNSGHLTGLIAFEIVKKFGEEKVGICSLPALMNNIPRQILLVKKIPCIIVIDGCRNECSKKILDRMGINYEKYINLENDFGYKKLGPFTTFEYSENDAKRISSNITKIIEPYLNT